MDVELLVKVLDCQDDGSGEEGDGGPVEAMGGAGEVSVKVAGFTELQDKMERVILKEASHEGADEWVLDVVQDLQLRGFKSPSSRISLDNFNGPVLIIINALSQLNSSESSDSNDSE